MSTATEGVGYAAGDSTGRTNTRSGHGYDPGAICGANISRKCNTRSAVDGWMPRGVQRSTTVPPVASRRWSLPSPLSTREESIGATVTISNTQPGLLADTLNRMGSATSTKPRSTSVAETTTWLGADCVTTRATASTVAVTANRVCASWAGAPQATEARNTKQATGSPRWLYLGLTRRNSGRGRPFLSRPTPAAPRGFDGESGIA